MVLRGMITVTTVLLCLVLGLLSPAPAALGSYSGRGCCTRYSRKPVPFQRIKGYREQTFIENCRIEAIIFYTIKNHEVCANRKDEWVRKILELLSSKLKKMSNTSRAAGEAVTKRHGNPTIKDGGGSVLNTAMNTTETFANSTESFY